MIELAGPFAEARAWLLDFMAQSGIKNETLSLPLEADWSGFNRMRCAYILGVVWGRLRQTRAELETATDFARIVGTALDEPEDLDETLKTTQVDTGITSQ
jgi:hypothetical protein